VVVLDPNGDFVRFGDSLKELSEVNSPTSRCSVSEAELAACRELHRQKADRTAVLSADESVQGKTPISIRLRDLDLREVAAVLDLNPATNPEEYSVLGWVWGAVEEPNGQRYTLGDLRQQLEQVEFRAVGDTKWAAGLLLRRLSNARLEQLSIWGAADEVPLVSLLRDESVQAVVVDLSTLDNLEKALVSSLVFRTVWGLQGDRRRKGVAKCSVLVLDEAHYMFPKSAVLAEQALTVDWGAKIAGEGRKYGVYLVAASQLPSKLHEHVLTQCGNVIVMKMSSQSDISAVQESLSFVPGALLERAKWFDQGDALLIGDIVPAPSCLLHFEGRKTQEGGRDLKVDWGEPGSGGE
jgi:hypothetical protein